MYSMRMGHLSNRNHKICWNDNHFYDPRTHRRIFTKSFGSAQALENALLDTSESNRQSVQRAVEIIKKEILLLAEQYPIIKDITSLPGINSFRR